MSAIHFSPLLRRNGSRFASLVVSALLLGACNEAPQAELVSGINAETRNKAALQVSGQVISKAGKGSALVSAADVDGQSLCNGWEQVQVGDFVMENNIWGVGHAGGAEYLQCMQVQQDASGGFEMSWGWDWPVGGGLVKGYPVMIYGDKFGLVSAPKRTTGLPAKLRSLDEYIIHYDMESLGVSGASNIALESWMHTTKKTAIDNVGVEMMVWLDRTETFNTWGAHLWDVEIDGVTFELYQTDAPGWSYIAFVPKARVEGSRLRWNSFVEHLLDTGLADSGLYMANIEFGTELVSGQGDFTLKNFAIERGERSAALRSRPSARITRATSAAKG